MSTPGDLLNALGREARARLGGRDTTTPRVFRGRTIEELIPRIERDLGADAIVVRRREGLTGGVLGFFQHPWVEIEAIPGTAGVDLYDDPADVVPAPADEPPPSPAAGPEAAYASGIATGAPPAAAIPPAFAPPAAPPPAATPVPPSAVPVPPPAAPAPPPAPPAAGPPAFAAPAPSHPPAAAGQPVYAPPAPAPAQEPGGSAYVTAQLAALARAEHTLPPPLVPQPAPPDPFIAPAPFPPAPPSPLELRELIPEQPRRPAAPIAPPPPADWTTRAPAERRVVAPGSHARARAGIEKGLARYGIGEQLANELIDMALAHALPLAPRSGLAAAVRTTLSQRIPVAPPLSAQGASIVLVGAGGAGKTTCCAALLDAYRAGSTLRPSFATIVAEGSGGDLRLLMSPQLLKPTPLESPRALRALRRARAEGLAVLDTPRLSPSDRKGIRRLGRLLGELDPDRILLALPATLGSAAASQLLEALAPLRADALVVTHADETDQIGVAVEVACRFELAPEYMLSHARAGGWRLRRLEPAGLAGMVLP